MHPLTLRFSDPDMENALLQVRERIENVRTIVAVALFLLLLLTVHPSSRVDHVLHGHLDTFLASNNSVAFTLFVSFIAFVIGILANLLITDTANLRLAVEAIVIVAFVCRDAFGILAWLNSRTCGQHDLGPFCAQLDTTSHACASQQLGKELSNDAAERVMQCAGGCLFLTLLIIGVHMVHLRWYAKCTVVLLPTLGHWLAPTWGIGWVEGYLFVMAAVSGVRGSRVVPNPLHPARPLLAL